MDPVKDFSKIRLLQTLGLLSRKFNYVTLEFETSGSFRLIIYTVVSLVSKPLFTIKMFISNFFPKTHIAQLYIGSIWNWLPKDPNFYLGIASAIAAIWSLFFHFVFNHLNSKNDYRLYKVWMKLTLELPVSSDRDYRVAGLSVEENKKFWLMENRVNHIWSQVINYYTAFVSLIFSSQLFFVKFSTFYGLKKSNKI